MISFICNLCKKEAPALNNVSNSFDIERQYVSIEATFCGQVRGDKDFHICTECRIKSVKALLADLIKDGEEK